jgi:succinate dehydrogenase/fumarate reductase-like Fe-S protein
MSRILKHPIIDVKPREIIKFVFEGLELEGLEGDTIASALIAHGVTTMAYSIKKHRPRGFYCAIGNCASCEMTVNGHAHVRTCITPLEENMIVVREHTEGQKL